MANVDTKYKDQYEKVPVDENKKNIEYQVPSSYGLGARHIQALLVFTCICINLVARAHPAVTIVAMVTPKHVTDNLTAFAQVNDLNMTNNTYLDILHGNQTTDEVNELLNTNAFGSEDKDNGLADTQGSVWNVYRTYSWPTWVQETLLGSFFVGYALAMWPTGLLIQRFGGKRPLQVGLLVSGLLSIATPHLACWGGWKAVAVSRVATGLAQAGTYPSATTLVARWVSPSERAAIGTYVFIGSMVGTVVAFQLAGVLAASRWGWPATYWVCGLLCLATCALMSVFGHRSPADHPTISDGERNFIMGKVFTGKEKKRIPTPWRRIMTSRPVWAGFVAHFGSSAVFMFMFTQVPSYLHHILGINIKSSGLLSSLPYLANAFSSGVVGYLSDYCTNRRLLSIRQARIISSTLAGVVPAVCLLLLGYTRRPELAIPLLVLIMAAFAGHHTSWMVNYIDLTPNFSGALMATGNTIMNGAAIGLPMLVARIVTDEHNPVQWRVVLFTLAAASVLCNAVYVTFMSADVQPWNEPEEPESKEMEAKQKS